MKQPLDPRINAFRDDLVADGLREDFPDRRFASAQTYHVCKPVEDLVARPQKQQALLSQLLFGESFEVYELKAGWAWGQAKTDGYVGYVSAAALTQEMPVAEFVIAVLRTPIFLQADLKAPVLGYLHRNSLIAALGKKGKFTKISNGWVCSQHIKKLVDRPTDWVAVAQSYLHTPYVWGGRSSFGLDCSALVQNALFAVGICCPRDADMQEAALGKEVAVVSAETDLPPDLRKGDLIFWPGHVGIMLDARQILHANAHHMATSIEPLTAAIGRNQKTSEPIRSIRRFF